MDGERGLGGGLNRESPAAGETAVLMPAMLVLSQVQRWKDQGSEARDRGDQRETSGPGS